MIWIVEEGKKEGAGRGRRREKINARFVVLSSLLYAHSLIIWIFLLKLTCPHSLCMDVCLKQAALRNSAEMDGRERPWRNWKERLNREKAERNLSCSVRLFLSQVLLITHRCTTTKSGNIYQYEFHLSLQIVCLQTWNLAKKWCTFEGKHVSRVLHFSNKQLLDQTELILVIFFECRSCL